MFRRLLGVRRLITVLRVHVLTIDIVVALKHPSRLIASHGHIVVLALPLFIIIIDIRPMDIGMASLLLILILKLAGSHHGDTLEVRSALLCVCHLAKLVELAGCDAKVILSLANLTLDLLLQLIIMCSVVEKHHTSSC